MVETYLNCPEATYTSIAAHFGYERHTIGKILKSFHIPQKKIRPWRGRHVYAKPIDEDGMVLSFVNIISAAHYIRDIRGGNLNTIYQNIAKKIDNPARQAYGFHWSSIDWKKGYGPSGIAAILMLFIEILLLLCFMFFSTYYL